MHFAYHDDELLVEPNKDDLIARILAREGIHTTDGKLTPELLTAGHDRPWSFQSKEDRLTDLSDLLSMHAPIGEFAQEAVLGELEHILKTGPTETPNDVHPADSDTHTYALEDWLCEHVAIEQFKDKVWAKVEQSLMDKLHDEVADLWGDVTDEIGNPAMATTTEIQGEIDRLEE